ncbi:MAG: AMP-binding protein [Bryobacterales bacterium]|nr:AMP-binding protein [Bryobacterales bacterium]
MVKRLCRLIVRLLFRLEVRGEVPKELPAKLVIVANHQSFADGLIMEGLLPFPVTWVVHTSILANPLFRWMLGFVRYVSIDAANPLSIKTLVGLIEAGERVAMFPEGRITVTGSLMKTYDGPAFLAARTGAALLPIRLDGFANSYLARTKPPFPKKLRPKASVMIEPLAHVPMPEARTGRERRRLASFAVQRLLADCQVRARPEGTLWEAFLDAVELHGRKAPLVEDIRGVEDNYGRVLRAALALGRLVSRLAEENEAVGVLMPNAAPSVYLLLGMFATRRIPAMLNYTSGVEGMQSAIETARIRTVITSHAFVERAKLADKVTQLRNVKLIYLEDLRPTFKTKDKLWLMLRALPAPRSLFRPPPPDSPAVILFTSGSEGKPKGVVLSHASILANIAQIRSVIEFSNKDRFFVALPIFHSFGLTAGTLIPLLYGARLYLYPSPLHYRIVPEMTYDRDCTVLFGTGTFLGNYARFAHPYDFHNVRYVISGAERLSPEVRKTWMDKFGIRIFEGYGATECSPVISVNTPMAYREDTVGQLLPGIEYRLEEMEGLPRGKVLHVRGPNVMQGYYLPDAPGVLAPPQSAFGPGWYNTGDVVEMQEGGYIRIVDRVKRFAKVAGEMVSLEIAERMAAAASPKHAHAATAVPSGRRGEVIVLFTDDGALSREQLTAAARQMGLPEIGVPRLIHRVDRVPRLGSGKFDYMRIKQLAKEEFEGKIA